MPRCPNCGTAVNPSKPFCGACGAPQRAESSPTSAVVAARVPVQRAAAVGPADNARATEAIHPTAPQLSGWLLVSLAGFGLAVLGTFMPWDYYGSTGWDDYIAACVVIVVLSGLGAMIALRPGASANHSLIRHAPGIAGALVAVFGLLFISSSDYSDIEAGIYVVIAGGVLAAAASFLGPTFQRGSSERHSRPHGSGDGTGVSP